MPEGILKLVLMELRRHIFGFDPVVAGLFVEPPVAAVLVFPPSVDIGMVSVAEEQSATVI